jgi:carboxyl-terminal processing protease
MEVFSWTILQLKQDYVDPSRIRPEAMLRRTLQYLERRTPNVEITLSEKPSGEAGSPERSLVARVQAGGQRQEFPIGNPKTIWEMNYALVPVFRFLAANLEPDTDPKDIEFAAINGMLSTLDPHSNLLPPELFREMQLKTQGEFGGLGIRIAIRKGALTIISPLPDTPAARLGLRAMDQIVRINDQSTVNLPLDEAVNMLRGKPGTKVTIWIMRSGWSEPHPYVMTRENIQVRSIESKLLADRVGYIQIQDFAKNTPGDFLRHLNELKREAKGLRGLIMDLRNNAGGLLKAAVQVADLFLPSGIIVATVAYSEDGTPDKPEQKNREEQRATGDAVEPDLPLVVLVNAGSASASEILAGALKNLDRAILLGDQTFGKGSVQVLNEHVPSSVRGACLKLTVAEYLIPGDVSIQEVGVTPDIQMIPMIVDAESVEAFAQPERFRERDIPAHLRRHMNVLQKPSFQIAYLKDASPRPAEGEEPPLEEPGFKEDEEIRLARDILLRASSNRGTTMLDQAAAYLKEVADREQKNLTERLRKLGVDWSPGTAQGGRGEASFRLAGEGVDAQGRVRADGKVRLVLSVSNTGKEPIFRLRAESACKNKLFDKREFLFGRINPGETRSFEVPIKIPRNAHTRTDDLRLSFFAEGSPAPAPLAVTISTVGRPMPAFGYSLRVLDREGNGDGAVQPGEKVELEVTVHNLGEGPAFEAKGYLKNQSGRDLFLETGRGQVNFKDIPPGQSRSERFAFRVPQDTAASELKMELNLYDATLGAGQTADVRLPVLANPPYRVETIQRRLEIRADRAELRDRPAPDGAVTGWLKKGSVFTADRRVGRFLRLAATNGWLGWVADDAVAPTRRAPAGSPIPLCQFTPPRIELEVLPDYLTDDSAVTLRGRVRDEDADVRDVAVWLGSDKVFLETGRDGGNPRQFPFEVRLSLDPGPNFITVVAREGTQFATQRTLVVTRPGGLDFKKVDETGAEEDPESLLME